MLIGNSRLMTEEGIDLRPAEDVLKSFAAEGKTPMLAAMNGRILGLVAVADRVRPESKEAIAALERMGLDVIMVTGDNRRTAEAIARQVGIERVIAEVLPAEKAEEIQAFARRWEGGRDGRRRNQ